MGFVSAEQAMAELDILVHPAGNESFGRTAVEAMAAGLPVVGVAGGGIGETVVDGETGFLAPPDSVSALAARIAEAHRIARASAAVRQRRPRARPRPVFRSGVCGPGRVGVQHGPRGSGASVVGAAQTAWRLGVKFSVCIPKLQLREIPRCDAAQRALARRRARGAGL